MNSLRDEFEELMKKYWFPESALVERSLFNNDNYINGQTQSLWDFISSKCDAQPLAYIKLFDDVDANGNFYDLVFDKPEEDGYIPLSVANGEN